MSDTSSNSSGGVGIAGVLGIVFIVLKLVHVIDWSWWWVLAPFWIGFALWVVILGIGLLVIAVAGGSSRVTRRKINRRRSR